MRLKKIKLAGFKSFVDPTTIPFPDEMTAVVGPNGCGKSNVIDAVRWVLGESSAKNLRGDAMTDVIFNGSTARKPVSQCSVELVFDNSSGRIKGEYAGYNELSVKRVVTKDAVSSYFLNSAKCRRRDVTDLFLGTGLGPRSYAIIEQGMISRLIESKPQELRVFIEEAAGVSKYKERRRETETRIRHTKENLERLEDVRGELGQQLEKLQRQASAAKRYKELKKSERTYKAEFAAIRWLKHSEKVESLEVEIARKNSDIEAYVAEQRSEEKDITEFKEQQQDFKQQLTDIQQQTFRVGTDITRIEQNQIHTKQRRQQIELETKSLEDAISDSEIHHQQNLEKVDDLSQQLALGEPEKVLLEEQLEQSQFALVEAEGKLNLQQNQWRNKEQEYNQTKAKAQGCHGQIQSLMNIQMRTQQRLGELNEELKEVVDDALVSQIYTCQEESLCIKEQIEDYSAAYVDAEQAFQTSQHELKSLEQELLDSKGDAQSIGAQLAALHALQNVGDDQEQAQVFLQQRGIENQSWWKTLEIKKGWESAFETITQQWQKAFLLKSTAEDNRISLNELGGTRWIFEQDYTDSIPSLSIGNKLHNTSIPKWLCQIYYAEDVEQGMALLQTLGDHQSVITCCGCWLGKGWIVNGCAEQHAGLLKRAGQIKELEKQRDAVGQELTALETKRADVLQGLEEHKETFDKRYQALEASKQALLQNQNQLQLLEQQQQQNLGRNQRLTKELARQQETFEEEQLQLEELSMQAEELEQKVEELQEQQLTFEHNREVQQQKVADCRTNLENYKSKTHQLALHLQSIQSQYDGLMAGQQRDLQLLTSMQEKLGVLKAEYTELSLPLEDQQESLQLLLEQRATLELSQNDLSEKLSLVENKLLEAEKGQQGVTDKIQMMLTELQSIKLECEGYRVRANGVLEQLKDMQQELKPILEALPDNADENAWQTLLDKTTASISRLGAVNLAAVEEYDIQAERKKHLDDQNDDLVSAMEILEQAIRKIDRETRTRFKETFEQVNDDLKMLFPKVFGGGSAYLELTDDDLLETGVTIMARPPGKKNSTIHLLSGGEKALTALSLVFAIFRLNPAPFCLLDEVDAPLDDANVGRFCKLVSEMSKSVQFIYITHNKIAMEMATHLTGVTMAEPGVSRMVAVDVDEAVAIAQA